MQQQPDRFAVVRAALRIVQLVRRFEALLPVVRQLQEMGLIAQQVPDQDARGREPVLPADQQQTQNDMVQQGVKEQSSPVSA